jgi:hypothetical protein
VQSWWRHECFLYWTEAPSYRPPCFSKYHVEVYRGPMTRYSRIVYGRKFYLTNKKDLASFTSWNEYLYALISSFLYFVGDRIWHISSRFRFDRMLYLFVANFVANSSSDIWRSSPSGSALYAEGLRDKFRGKAFFGYPQIWSPGRLILGLIRIFNKNSQHLSYYFIVHIVGKLSLKIRSLLMHILAVVW